MNFIWSSAFPTEQTFFLPSLPINPDCPNYSATKFVPVSGNEHITI